MAKTTVRLADLPVEVVIDILVLAARNAVDENRGWLCKLARTSSPVWRAVQPILYETVVIDHATCQHVLPALRRSANFLATRHLLIDTLAGAEQQFSASIDAVARAFANATHVASSQEQLRGLMAAHDRFRPPRFTCIGPFERDFWARAATDLPFLRGVTHIHTCVSPSRAHMAPAPTPPPFTHVVVLLHPEQIDLVLGWFLASAHLQQIAVWDLWGTTDWEGLLGEFVARRRSGERRVRLLAHAECSRIAGMEINRRGLGVYRPMVTFEHSLWDSGKEIRGGKVASEFGME